MASSSSAAVLLALPFPSPSSSDDSDDARLLPPPPPSGREAAFAPPCRPQPQPQQQRPRRRRRQSLERDFNVQMAALARAGDADQVVDLFGELRRRAASGAAAAPNVLCYNTLLNALAEAGRVEEVEDAMAEMDATGVAPNTSTLNILVKLHACRFSEFDEVYKLINRMQGQGVEADIGTYSTLITGLSRAGRLVEALGVLDKMLEDDCVPLVHTYTPIVQGYCREGRIEEAKKLMAGMEAIGLPPNVVTYNVLIRALCDNERFDEVKQVLAESTTKGWKPSTVTYNTYMNGLCENGMAKEALEQYDVMQAEGLDPTSFSLSIRLNCLCHVSRVSDAVSLLLEESTALNWSASVVAYNTVMSRLGALRRWSTILSLLAVMIRKGINPNARTFNILIHGLCIRGESSLAKNLVYNRVFAANAATYNTLIHWFYYRGKFREVYDLVSDMNAAMIHPDEVTFTTMVDGLCRERKFAKATSLFLASLKSGLSRDLLLVLINRLVHSACIKEICYTFEGMVVEGFLPDHSIFDYAIRSFCRVGFCHGRGIVILDIVLDTMLGKKTFPIEERFGKM